MTTMEPPSKYVPRVTKSFIKEPGIDYSKVDALRFHDSDILLCVVRGYLHISSNNGQNWQTVDAFEGQLIRFVGVDVFHKGRAFVTSQGARLHVTEDQGRSWKQIEIPNVDDKYLGCMGVETHPIDRSLLLFRISISSGRDIAYASDDAGKSFKCIIPPPANYREEEATGEGYDCRFAVSSKESNLENNGIYYVRKRDHEFHNTQDDVEWKQEKCKNTLFYTADFGKTTRVFNELNGRSVEDIFIFPSSVIILTSEGRWNTENRTLWISRGGSFEPIRLPGEEETFLESAYPFPVGQDFTSECDQKRLLLQVRTGTNDWKPSLRELDLFNLKSSEHQIPSSYEMPKYLGKLRNLKETSRGRLYPKWHDRKVNHNRPLRNFAHFAHFDDLETLMFVTSGFLHISFNAGESWKTVDEFREGKVYLIWVDPFHKKRAFVRSRGGKVHVTEDEGRSWRELVMPDDEYENQILFSQGYYESQFRIRTHPIDRKLLLFHVHAKPEKGTPPLDYMADVIVYASTDAGRSYRKIAPPANYPWATPNNQKYEGHFAVSSKESNFENNGIYYIRRVRYAEDLMEECFTDALELAEQETGLHYTADFSETTKTFDELKDSSIDGIFIFPSGVIVLTSEGGWNDENKNLWISKGGRFEPIRLPDEVISLQYAQYCSEDNEQRLLLRTKVNDDKDHNTPSRSLILDPLTLNFSWNPPPPWFHKGKHGAREYVKQLGNLKGTFWKEISGPLNRVEKGSQSYFCATQASFDNGKSWTNLRVTDPSGKHKHLFDGDIEDVETCSFQESDAYRGYNECVPENKQTAGIIIKIGTVGKTYERSNRDMTFISRDGGVSWELAFEFPVVAAYLDFGNIIIAIPRKDTEVYKFYFSLDQGRKWDEYRLDIPTSHFCIHTLGLKALIEISTEVDPAEYLFYSIDFSNIFGGTACTEDDLERWYLNNGNCIDGVRYSFDRRKPDAKCLVRKTFQKLELHEEKCES